MLVWKAENSFDIPEISLQDQNLTVCADVGTINNYTFKWNQHDEFGGTQYRWMLANWVCSIALFEREVNSCC